MSALKLPNYMEAPRTKHIEWPGEEMLKPEPIWLSEGVSSTEYDPLLANVPVELREFKSWVMWKYVTRDGKRTKPPHDYRTGRITGANNESIHLSFEAAKAILDFGENSFDGIGLVLKPEYGIIGYDADHCIDADGNIDPIAQSDIDAWNTYAEISPSGEGIRMFAFGVKPGDRNKAGGFEMYDGNSTRYLTVTGDMVSQATSVNTPTKAVIETTYTRIFAEDLKPGNRAESAATGGLPEGKEDLPAVDKDTAEFQDLEAKQSLRRMLGDEKFHERWEKPGTDGDSERNLALANHIIYLLKDELKPLHQEAQIDRVERVMRSSPAQREKWDSPRGDSTWLRQQIRVALNSFKDFSKKPKGVEVKNVRDVKDLCDAFIAQPAIEERNLINFQDSLYQFKDGAYQPMETIWLQNRMTKFIPTCYANDEKGKLLRGNATVTMVKSVVSAVMAELHEERFDEALPFWRDAGVAADSPPPERLILFKNGMLDIDGREFYPPTPKLFALNPLPFDYNLHAPSPERFLQFLGEVWPDDPASHNLLQEILGYIISGDTSLQKIFVLIGIRRGGKGVLGRLMKSIVGSHAFAGNTLKACEQQFGLAGLVDKKLWIVADARIGKGVNQAAIVERLLNISGEDPVSVPRKYKEDWNGILSPRLVIMSNAMPKLYEPSGAMEARLIPLKFTQSFEGREDNDLDAKLLSEISGIINWALDGLERLRKNRRFTETADTREMKADFRDVADPMAGFVGTVIAEDPMGEVITGDLFYAWDKYRSEEDIPLADNSRAFGHLLKEVMPSVRKKSGLMRNGKKVSVYKGVKIIDEDYLTSDFKDFLG